MRKKHDAVVLAVGLSTSRGIPLKNGDHDDVLLALPFLRAAALQEPVDVRDQVLVIGGGNVAVDVARTAVRLGAKTVQMVCLENEEEMPAWDWECHEALEEGIGFVHRQGPTEVVVEDGKITGLLTREVTRVFDDAGRFSPEYNDANTTTIPGQMLILAIGQSSDMGLVEGTDVRVDERGRLDFSPETMATNVAGVFACGEVVAGPGAAIEAVASGHRAAQAAMGYLETGQAPAIPEQEVEHVAEMPEDVIEHVKRVERMAMPAMSPEERKKSFVQFELGYTEEQALAEARRCLSCVAGAAVDETKCAACLTCLRVCPFGVPAVDDIAVMASEMCQACGLCAVECPAMAISIKRFKVGDIKDRIVTLLEGAGKPVQRVDIVCAQEAKSREELQDRIVQENGTTVAVIPVTTTARAEEVDLMKPFELGVAEVRVEYEKDCRYRGAMDRLAKRVGRTKQILDAVGVGGDKLTLVGAD